MKDAADAIEELISERDDWESIAKHKAKIIKKMESEQRDIMQQLPNWISVGERLPEDRQDVLCLLENKVVRILKFSPVQTTWFPQGFSYEHNGMNIRQTGNNVTHWMPLPEPPKEVE